MQANTPIAQFEANVEAGIPAAVVIRPEAKTTYRQSKVGFRVCAHCRKNRDQHDFKNGGACPSDVRAITWAVVQEGGSSGEWYVHTFDSADDANAYRKGAAKAAYRTSEPVELTGDLTQSQLDDLLQDAENGDIEVDYPPEDAAQHQQAEIHEYAFDVKLVAALRVRATTEVQARKMILKALDCATANLGAWPDGSPILAEVSTSEADIGDTYEIDGEAV